MHAIVDDCGVPGCWLTLGVLCCVCIVLQVECDVGAPQVNYRESISRPNDIRYQHKKQSGGSGQFADVAIKFEPGEPGSGFVFRSDIKGGAVPKEYIPGE